MQNGRIVKMSIFKKCKIVKSRDFFFIFYLIKYHLFGKTQYFSFLFIKIQFPMNFYIIIISVTLITIFVTLITIFCYLSNNFCYH